MKTAKLIGAIYLLISVVCLNAETIAYWPLDNAKAGTAAEKRMVLKTRINSPALDARVCPNDKTELKFSADVPGKVIIAGKDKKVINPNNDTSIQAVRKSGADPAFTVAGDEFPQPESFTVEAFVKIKESPQWACILGKGRQGGFSWLLQLNAAGELRARIDSNSPEENSVNKKGYNQGINTKCSILDNKWHHIAMTYDNKTAELIIYVDYTIQAKAKISPSMIVYDDRQLFFLGGMNGAAGASGLIDEIRISDTALDVDDFLKVKNN